MRTRTHGLGQEELGARRQHQGRIWSLKDGGDEYGGTEGHGRRQTHLEERSGGARGVQLGGEGRILVTGAVDQAVGWGCPSSGAYGAETEVSGVCFGQGWGVQPKHLEMGTGDKTGVGDVGC